MSARIATLTLNPSIDGSCDTDVVRHTHKVRTTRERFDPGGGGINVARVLARLGADVEAIYLAGGATGSVLDDLLGRAGLRRRGIPVHDDTRVALAVHERSTGREYRFVPEGPELSPAECAASLAAVEDTDCDFLVASGSLPPGAGDDYYAHLAEVAARRGVALLLDTSGPALRHALDHGGMLLVKPSLNELEQLVGRRLRDPAALARAAEELVTAGKSRHVAVTMGHEGALLATADGPTLRLPAIPVEVRSAVGAGDSFVAGMTHGLAQGWPAARAFRLGLAAGSAAVLSPGTGLCSAEDVWRLFATAEELEAV